jgi:hypothetical protein
VASPSPPPPILRQISPGMISPALENISRPGGILSKASKKWMGDLLPPTAPTTVDPPQQLPAEVAKRWNTTSEQLTLETRMDSPDCVEKKWAMECLPSMRSPDMLAAARRIEISSFARGLRPGDQELPDSVRI